MTTTDNTQKTASKQDIKDAAIELIKKNTTTTNLDIKTHLRANGFWVSQDEVSDAMRSIASEENFDRQWNGTYNTWSIPADSTTSTPAAQDNTQSTIIAPAVTGNDANAVIDAISGKLGIYKQAIKPTSNLQKDLGFIDRDYDTIGQVFGKDIKDCKTVQDIIDLTK